MPTSNDHAKKRFITTRPIVSSGKRLIVRHFYGAALASNQTCLNLAAHHLDHPMFLLSDAMDVEKISITTRPIVSSDKHLIAGHRYTATLASK